MTFDQAASMLLALHNIATAIGHFTVIFTAYAFFRIIFCK